VPQQNNSIAIESKEIPTPIHTPETFTEKRFNCESIASPLRVLTLEAKFRQDVETQGFEPCYQVIFERSRNWYT